MKRPLEHYLTNRLIKLPRVLYLLKTLSKRYRIHLIAKATAEYLEEYTMRKQFFVFAKYVATAYESTELHKDIAILDFADKVNKKLQFPVPMDIALEAELHSRMNNDDR